MAPMLAKCTTDRLAQQTDIPKQRRKAREEFATAKAKTKASGGKDASGG